MTVSPEKETLLRERLWANARRYRFRHPGSPAPGRTEPTWVKPEVAPDGTPASVLYFAYGSNMSSARLGARVRNLPGGVTAHLASHRRTFDKPETHGGKTNIQTTNDSHDVVPGVVFELTSAQLADVSTFEAGYKKESVHVTLVDGDEVEAVTFVAVETKDGLRPTRRYLRHLIDGAREHAFSGEEIASIESTNMRTS